MKFAPEATLDSLERKEKIALVAGTDMWHTAEIERLGIPALWMSDGPNGLRGTRSPVESTSPCFPCGAALGATFDPELVADVGAALGLEARRMGVHVLLGPTMNIMRLPIAGRNFECFSEDPYLSSRLAVAYIRGVQSRGVAAVAKHFVCNDSERNRFTTSSEVDERALREIYLPPFAASVREANVWAVMSAYNRINGTYACEHEMLRDLLKGEWGFTGAVISDWFGTMSTVEAARGALDIEMPGPPLRWGKKLFDAIDSGEVDISALNDKVLRILRLIERTTGPAPADDGTPPGPLIRRAAAEGTVLLQNRGALLPLDPSRLARIAVIGPNARNVQLHGGGSARVNAPYVVTPFDAIRERCDGATEVAYEPGCLLDRALPVLGQGSLLGPDGTAVEEPVNVEYFDNPHLEGNPVCVESAPAMHFAWNGPPVPGLKVGEYSVRLTSRLFPDATGRGEIGMHGVGNMRLLLDGKIVIDNFDAPLIAPEPFGKGPGQLTAPIECVAGVEVHVEVDFRAPDPEVCRGALDVSLMPLTEHEKWVFGLSGVTVGYRDPAPSDLLGRAERLVRNADVAVVVVGTNEQWETERLDREGIALPGDQDALIARVAKANPNVVVVVNAGSPVAMDFAQDVAAILQLWFPGQEAGNALCDVLFGDVNPSGRLPVTVPVRLEDSGAAYGYPAVDDRLRYTEGVFVGYRHFDDREIAPRFCFGHGLSYTTFSYGALSVAPGKEGVLLAEVEVTNTGTRAGAEVVQLYVDDIEAYVSRPQRELKGIAKLRIEAGERATAAFPLAKEAFAFWDVARHDWIVEPGEFELSVGASSRDIRSSKRIFLDADAKLV